jgi:membrane fusion protein (multidrug efflux system)
MLNLSYTAITAAIDGQVSKIDIQPGQLVQPGQLFISTTMKLGS